MTQRAKGNFTVAYTDLSSADKPEDWFYGGTTVRSLFNRRVQHCAIYTQITCNNTNSGSVEQPIFELTPSADYARGGWIEAVTPKVTVKADNNGQKKYRIAMTWNPAHQIFNTGALKFNELPVASYDAVALDLVSQFRVPAAKWPLYQKMIGNVPELQEWSSELPSYTVKLPCPFFYAQDPTQSLPIFRATLNRIKEEYTVQTDLRNLIRLQINDAADVLLDEPIWRDAKAGEVDLTSILAVEGNRHLEITEVRHWTKYVLMHDDERELLEDQTYEMVIEQTQSVNGKKAKVGEHRKEFRFNGPVKAVFFAMLNKTSELYNNRSNYSDDYRSEVSGSDPVARATLTYDNDSRFENVPGDWFDHEVWDHAARSISEPGMHGLFYNRHINDVDLTGSTNYSHMVTGFSLDVAEKSAQDNEYLMVVRGLSAHRLTFKNNGAGFLAF